MPAGRILRREAMPAGRILLGGGRRPGGWSPRRAMPFRGCSGGWVPRRARTPRLSESLPFSASVSGLSPARPGGRGRGRRAATTRPHSGRAAQPSPARPGPAQPGPGLPTWTHYRLSQHPPGPSPCSRGHGLGALSPPSESESAPSRPSRSRSAVTVTAGEPRAVCSTGGGCRRRDAAVPHERRHGVPHWRPAPRHNNAESRPQGRSDSSPRRQKICRVAIYVT
jgi:hypothetical protein